MFRPASIYPAFARATRKFCDEWCNIALALRPLPPKTMPIVQLIGRMRPCPAIADGTL